MADLPPQKRKGPGNNIIESLHKTTTALSRPTVATTMMTKYELELLLYAYSLLAQHNLPRDSILELAEALEAEALQAEEDSAKKPKMRKSYISQSHTHSSESPSTNTVH
jgi:hypothetical protein